MDLKVFTPTFATQNLPFIALGCVLPAYISKSKTELLSRLPSLSLLMTVPKPLYSFTIGLKLYSIVDLTGQIRKATTKTDRFILICTAYIAAEYAYDCFMKHLLQVKKTEKLPSDPLKLHTRNFIIITKTVAMAVQIAFHPLVTIAGVVTGCALSVLDISSMIQNIEDENLRAQCSQAWQLVEPYLIQPQEIRKTVHIWNEWSTVANSVVTENGAFIAGVQQGNRLALLLGKIPPRAPTGTTS